MNTIDYRSLPLEDKIKRCREILAGYPDEHQQREAVERQIEKYEQQRKEHNK